MAIIKNALINFLQIKQEIIISFKNLTSESPVIDNVKLISLRDNGCTIALPSKSCSLGHQTFLSIVIKEESKAKTMKILGKVAEVMKINSSMNEVNIHFTQYSQNDWQEVLGIFESKQEIVSNTIKKLK